MPVSRAASSRTKVPNTSVRMNSPGSSIERSTCDSAAKLTTASQPSSAERTTSGSAMSPTTSSQRSRPSRFSRRPAYVSLSRTRTEPPGSASNRRRT